MNGAQHQTAVRSNNEQTMLEGGGKRFNCDNPFTARTAGVSYNIAWPQTKSISQKQGYLFLTCIISLWQGQEGEHISN